VTVHRAGTGWIGRMKYGVRTGIIALGLVPVAGLLAGCAGKSSPPSAAPANGGFQAYADCLRQHGVTVELPTARPSGVRPSGERPSVRPSGVRPSGVRRSGGFPGFGGQPPSGVDQATWDAAQQACASVRPSFGGGGGGNNGAIIAYRNCLRDHGVTASTGPDQLNSADPKVAAAMQVCTPLRPSGRPARSPSASPSAS